MKRLLTSVVTAAVVVLAACSDGEVTEPLSSLNSSRGGQSANGAENADDAATRHYRVTVENLTSGQPLSPGVVATHTKAASVFRVGEAASEGVRLIAESGDPSVAVGMLSGIDAVHMVKAFPDPLGPIHRQGGPGSTSGSIEIAARASANRLSLVIMLICTNDGFTGLESVKLPGGFKPAVYWVGGYDAGTEVNDESSENIVDACGAAGPVALAADGNGRTPEGGVITHHAGIQGDADLSESAHSWTDPVARITVERID